MTEESIFLEALEIADPAARATFLDAACGGDPVLRAQVEALVAAHERSGEFLDVPAVEQMADGPERSEGTVTFGPAREQVNEEDVLAFLQPSDAPASLGRLEHYEVQEVLGRGGFGTVLKAFDVRLHRVVAIKVMAPQLAASGSARKRFLREARSGAAVRDEHVVNIHAVSRDDEPVPHLVMEYVAGQTLQQKLDRAGPLPVREVLRIGHQIARGLAAAHATGVIHRDIKPANILLENGVERVKITDFGLARAADDASISQSGVIAGTPLYMAPEQAQGEPIDHRSDLFSLGSVLYAMCTGRPPFRASTTMAVLKRVVEEQPRPTREVNPEVPPWLCDVVTRLHAKNPAERFQTAQEVADLLAKYLTELQLHGDVRAPAPAPGAPRPPVRPRWRRRLLTTLSVLALLSAGAAVWIGPALRLNWENAGELTVSDLPPEFEGCQVFHEDLQSGHGSEIVTDRLNGQWMLKRGESLRLRPGVYSVRAVGREGQVARLWRLSRSEMFSGEIVEQEKEKCRLELNRGQRVGLSVVKWSVPPGPLTSPVPDKDGWVQLFNGKDLSGWKTHPDQPGDWKVENGVLVGRGPRSHLFSERGDFENFHLRVEAKINELGNSGVYFRTEYGLYWRGLNPKGYEAQIFRGDAGDRYKTGSLYGICQANDGPFPNPDTWFTLDVIAQGSHIIIRVDGRTTVDVVLDEKTAYKRGHFALQVERPLNTVVQFRKIEVKELPPGRPSESPQPFVVLPGGGKAEQKPVQFATLAEAVAAAQNGDTVEIHGDGPFLSSPIKVEDRALVIRAAAGFRPVIGLSPEGVWAAAPLLETNAPLVLEGLELRHLGGVRWELDGPLNRIISSSRAPLQVANCRFLLDRREGPQQGLHCVAVIESPRCELRNCEFLTGEGAALGLGGCPPRSRVVVENSVLVGGSGVVAGYGQPKPEEVALVLRRNTIHAYSSVTLNLLRSAEGEEGDSARKAFCIDASGNILGGRFVFNTVGKQLSAAEAEALLGRLVSWRDERNLYAIPRGDDFLTLSFLHKPFPALREHKSLADWKQFWHVAESDSLEGQARYKASEMLSRQPLPLEQLTPEDFRLTPSSLGQGAGKDGRDLGADVELVGPGAAYERWKKTPEYQQWRKQTEAALNAPPGDK